jgi:hypothetical protein
MTLNYTVTDDFKVIIKKGTKKIDEVGAFDSAAGAELWGSQVCDKYNSAEYADVEYPNELPEIG